ncbi:uncharacterized protein EI90DRAFT_3065639, partial [Cantharellus anzutake]|uniref:uncharacterized protein n=1 Tax=Cantharellus anzutake TaxID=1750568 RepID=UPI001902FF5B
MATGYYELLVYCELISGDEIPPRIPAKEKKKNPLICKNDRKGGRRFFFSFEKGDPTEF